MNICQPPRDLGILARMDPTSTPKRLRTLATWLLGQSSNQGHRLVGERMNAVGVPSRAHFSLLAALAETGPTSQADLGRRVGLDRSDVTAAVAEMESRGLLERMPDPADRRRNLVRLTEPGAAYLEMVEREVIRAQDELLAPLTEAERKQLLDMLGRIIEFHTGIAVQKDA
jgi:MarR family transcriptional regulator, lower aerobic nicotinate degradation pathway regulator